MNELNYSAVKVFDLSISFIFVVLTSFVVSVICASHAYKVALLGSSLYLIWYLPYVVNTEHALWYKYITIVKTPIAALLGAYLCKTTKLPNLLNLVVGKHKKLLLSFCKYFITAFVFFLFGSHIEYKYQSANNEKIMIDGANITAVYRISNALYTIDMIESGKIEELKNHNCVIMKIFSKGIKPDREQNEDQKQHYSNIKASARDKVAQMESEDSCK